MATHLDAGGYVFRTPAGGPSPLQGAAARRHDTQRLDRIARGWNFYYGEHWPFTREDGEPLSKTNYVRKFIDKKVEFLIGEDFTLTVPKSLEAVTLPKLRSVWDDNGRQTLNYEMGLEGAVTGDIFVLITTAPPTDMQLKYDPFMQQRIVIQRLQSHECYPLWDETQPPNRYGRPLLAFTIVRYLRRWNQSEQQDEEIRFVQTITADRIISQVGDEPPTQEPNILGEIPIVHIKNLPNTSHFGTDDISDLIPLNMDYNEKSTDISDTINYNTSPVLVVTGAKAKNLERSAKAIWAIPNAEADVKYLRLEGELTAAVSYLDRTKQSMHDISGVPASAFGDVKGLSGTSGVAFAMTLQPMKDERNRKRSSYEPGYERINYYILRYAEIFHDLRLPRGLCEKCGGKIAIFYVPDDGDPDDPDAVIQVRRCFQVDPDTLDFLDPRQSQMPVEKIIDTPPIVVGGEQYDNMPNAQRGDYGEQEPNIPEKFDLPLVQVEEIDATGAIIPGSRRIIQNAREEMVAIPMTCDSHTYLNPFSSYVFFNDTFPKDKKEQMDLLQIQLTSKLISRVYAMQQLGLERIDEMLAAIDAETDKEFERQMQMNMALNGMMPPEEGAGTAEQTTDATAPVEGMAEPPLE